MTNYESITALFKQASPLSQVPGTGEFKTKRILQIGGLILLCAIGYTIYRNEQKRREKANH